MSNPVHFLFTQRWVPTKAALFCPALNYKKVDINGVQLARRRLSPVHFLIIQRWAPRLHSPAHLYEDVHKGCSSVYSPDYSILGDWEWSSLVLKCGHKVAPECSILGRRLGGYQVSVHLFTSQRWTPTVLSTWNRCECQVVGTVKGRIPGDFPVVWWEFTTSSC